MEESSGSFAASCFQLCLVVLWEVRPKPFNVLTGMWTGSPQPGSGSLLRVVRINEYVDTCTTPISPVGT